MGWEKVSESEEESERRLCRRCEQSKEREKKEKARTMMMTVCRVWKVCSLRTTHSVLLRISSLSSLYMTTQLSRIGEIVSQYGKLSHNRHS
jgi:hypothetical protein